MVEQLEVGVAFVVASGAVHDLVRATSRPARVVAVLPAAIYLETGDLETGHLVTGRGTGGRSGSAAGEPRMIALLARDAVRVPIGLVTASQRGSGPFGTVRDGDAATIGEGELRFAGGAAYRPLRYWDPRVPRLGVRLATAEVRHRADALAVLAGGLPAEVVEHWGSAAIPLGAALARPLPRPPALTAAVDGLVGLGPGLTPAGDDVLAGALVALAAAGDETRSRALVAAVTSALGRTTPVSSALLDQACHGRSVPEVTGLLRALAGGGDLDAALRRLSLVGHTSGAALALGVRLALRAVDRHELGRVA